MTQGATATRTGTARQRGFTLIELMIVVVIIGIIATIATNMFSGAGQDAERSRILSEMTSLNDAMGRYYQANFSYAPATTNAALLATLRNNTIQATPSYTVTLETATATTYQFVARPVATGKMKNSGAYSLNQAGQRCRYVDDNPSDLTVCTQRW